KPWRPKAKKPKIGFFGAGAGKATKRAVTPEKLLRVFRQVARKSGDFGLAVKGLAVKGLAVKVLAAGRRVSSGRAEDRGEFFPAALHLGLAGRAHRGQCHDVDLGA